MPTIRDVAREASVSTSTVSHVINDTRYVAPETRERVLLAMRVLNYKHNRVASSLRNQKTHTFGVLLPNSANPYFAEVLAGIEEACYARRYNIILGNAHDDLEREIAYISVLLSRQVDGILLISTGAQAKSLHLIMESQTPVVLVDRSAEGINVDEIFTDNLGGGRLATEYLLSLGHQRIACVTGPSFLTPSAERVKGYLEALKAGGGMIDEALIVNGDFQHSGGYQATEKLLNLELPPTAIFACNDLMAIGVISAVHEAGLRVPEDVSVIGYDDIPLASYATPRLTTIAQPARTLGLLAVERLFARIDNTNSQISHERLNVSLIERDSCKSLTVI